MCVKGSVYPDASILMIHMQLVFTFVSHRDSHVSLYSKGILRQIALLMFSTWAQAALRGCSRRRNDYNSAPVSSVTMFLSTTSALLCSKSDVTPNKQKLGNRYVAHSLQIDEWINRYFNEYWQIQIISAMIYPLTFATHCYIRKLFPVWIFNTWCVYFVKNHQSLHKTFLSQNTKLKGLYYRLLIESPHSWWMRWLN